MLTQRPQTQKQSKVKWSESRSVISDSLQPHELYSPWYSPGKNTAEGSLSLLQRIYPTSDRTKVSCIAGGFFTSWATREDTRQTQRLYPISDEHWTKLFVWRLGPEGHYVGHIESRTKKEKKNCKLSLFPSLFPLSRQLALGMLWPTKCSGDGHPGFLSPSLQAPGNFCFCIFVMPTLVIKPPGWEKPKPQGQNLHERALRGPLASQGDSQSTASTNRLPCGSVSQGPWLIWTCREPQPQQHHLEQKNHLQLSPVSLQTSEGY